MQVTIQHNSDQQEYYFEENCYITEWWNSPADPGLSVARARVKPGEVTCRHSLEGVAERYVIIGGRGRVEVGGQPAREVSESDVVLIPPGVSQRIANTGREDLLFLAICTPKFTPRCYRER